MVTRTNGCAVVHSRSGAGSVLPKDLIRYILHFWTSASFVGPRHSISHKFQEVLDRLRVAEPLYETFAMFSLMLILDQTRESSDTSFIYAAVRFSRCVLGPIHQFNNGLVTSRVEQCPITFVQGHARHLFHDRGFELLSSISTEKIHEMLKIALGLLGIDILWDLVVWNIETHLVDHSPIFVIRKSSSLF